MFETLDKIMLAGLGAVSMTRERAEKLFDEFVEKGQAARESRSGFVRDLMDASERARRDLDKVVNEQVEKAVAKLNLPTREDLNRIEAKLDALLQMDK